MREFLQVLDLLLLFSLPGAALLLGLKEAPVRASVLLAGAVGVSVAYIQAAALILLPLGLFKLSYLWVLAALPIIFAFTRQKRCRENLSALLIDRKALLPALFSALVVIGVVLFTPRWNFLMAFGMDAGNYEIYSNHFWLTDSLYLDAARYQQAGIPVGQYTYSNAWNIHGGIGLPGYLYGYPALMGVVKKIFSSPSAGWMVSALAGSLSAFVSVLLLGRFAGGAVSVIVFFSIFLTPLFFYYTKQLMSEGTALLGALLLLLGLVEDIRSRRDYSLLFIASGLSLMLLTKIDAYVIPLFLCAGFFLHAAGIRNRRKWFTPGAYRVFGLVVLLSGLWVRFVCDPFYVRKFSIPWFENAFGIPFMIFSLAAVFAFSLLMGIFARKGTVFCGGEARMKIVNAAVLVFGILWIVFIIWNVTLRPVGVNIKKDHNPYNLLRLFKAYSPFVLALVLAAFAFVLQRAKGAWGVWFVAAGLHFCYLVWDSKHTYSDLWWMRRYLVVLIPLALVCAGHLWRAWAGREFARQWTVFLLAGLASSIVFQGIMLKPYFTMEMNGKLPLLMKKLKEQVPDEGLLVAAGSDTPVLGVVNSFASLRRGPTLFNTDLKAARAAFRDLPLAVVTDSPLRPSLVRKFKLSLRNRAVVRPGWSGWFPAVRIPPIEKRVLRRRARLSDNFYLYR